MARRVLGHYPEAIPKEEEHPEGAYYL